MASVCTPSLPHPGLARKNSVNIPDSTSGFYANQVVNQSKEQGDKETAELWKWAEVNTPEGKGGSERREGSGEPDCGQSHGGKSLDRGGEGMGPAQQGEFGSMVIGSLGSSHQFYLFVELSLTCGKSQSQ